MIDVRKILAEVCDDDAVYEELKALAPDLIITDIRMRMLQPRELFAAQGFPASYIIDHDADGNPYPKCEQTAKCGNAVTPPVACALVRANLPELCEGGSK